MLICSYPVWLLIAGLSYHQVRAVDYLPGWLISATWQLTIIFGVLTTPLVKVTRPNGQKQALKIPLASLPWMLVILLGVLLTVAAFLKVMANAKGYWGYTAALRYLWMLPLMLIVNRYLGSNLARVLAFIKQNLMAWLIWSQVCFVLFYVPLSLYQNYGMNASSMTATLTSFPVIPIFSGRMALYRLNYFLEVAMSNRLKAISIGIVAAFFFSITFIVNTPKL
ncbi:hypothetical protein GQS40_13270|uniref:Uncharacterized protein n=1 Tax=Leuconostoc lactis TaxID=1246 RepID=A0A6L7ACB6_LEULA|nr:hypothetical protein [Leuconostoc lactis]